MSHTLVFSSLHAIVDYFGSRGRVLQWFPHDSWKVFEPRGFSITAKTGDNRVEAADSSCMETKNGQKQVRNQDCQLIKGLVINLIFFRPWTVKDRSYNPKVSYCGRPSAPECSMVCSIGWIYLMYYLYKIHPFSLLARDHRRISLISTTHTCSNRQRRPTVTQRPIVLSYPLRTWMGLIGFLSFLITLLKNLNKK